MYQFIIDYLHSIYIKLSLILFNQVYSIKKKYCATCVKVKLVDTHPDTNCQGERYIRQENTSKYLLFVTRLYQTDGPDCEDHFGQHPVIPHRALVKQLEQFHDVSTHAWDEKLEVRTENNPRDVYATFASRNLENP